MRARSIILTIAALIAFCNIATAQTIALGEKTPRFKNIKWLDGNAPTKGEFTYIEFIHSASLPCKRSAERVYKIMEEFPNTAFVLVSHQSASEIDNWVTGYVSERAGVVVDDSRIRASFGVNYAPYAVILDHKRRALWFGNPQLLDKTTIEKIVKK